MKRVALLFGLLAGATLAMASGGEHSAGHEEIPWEVIRKQSINFVVIVAGLAWIIRSKLGSYLKGRVENFERLAVLAKKAREDAELQKKEIHSRLERLQATADESITKAKAEAAELKAKLKAEGEALASQIMTDAEATVKREIEKAKEELREEALSAAMKNTREMMKTSVKEPDQKRLQNEFVDKIQVIR